MAGTLTFLPSNTFITWLQHHLLNSADFSWIFCSTFLFKHVVAGLLLSFVTLFTFLTVSVPGVLVRGCRLFLPKAPD